MGQNKHTFWSRAFTFAWPAFWSILLPGYSSGGGGGADEEQTADVIPPNSW